MCSGNCPFTGVFMQIVVLAFAKANFSECVDPIGRSCCPREDCFTALFYLFISDEEIWVQRGAPFNLPPLGDLQLYHIFLVYLSLLSHPPLWHGLSWSFVTLVILWTLSSLWVWPQLSKFGLVDWSPTEILHEMWDPTVCHGSVTTVSHALPFSTLSTVFIML